jgi:HSP20 family protein
MMNDEHPSRNLGNGRDDSGGARAAPLLEPAIDVLETDDDVRLFVVLPGVEPGDICVSLTDEELDVVALAQGEDGRVIQREIRYGVYERRLVLPCPVDPARAEVVLRDGLLRVTVPRARYHS